MEEGCKMFGMKKKDPVCGMKQTGKGIDKHGHWFCSEKCLKQYEKGKNKAMQHCGCCH